MTSRKAGPQRRIVAVNVERRADEAGDILQRNLVHRSSSRVVERTGA